MGRQTVLSAASSHKYQFSVRRTRIVKKTIAALIILALIFSLSACGKSKDADSGTDGTSQTGDPKDSEMQSDTDADTEQENAEGSDTASSDIKQFEVILAGD